MTGMATIGRPRYAKLSPGPGRPASEVEAHQRARIHSATIEIVGEDGYDAVTVRRLASVAGISTKTFYQHFEGKEECFLRTYEAVVERVAARVVSAQAGEPDWRERLRLAFEAFAREMESKPRAARLVFVEAFGAGPAAFEAMRRSEVLFERMLASSFGRAPTRGAIPPLLIKAIVEGTTFVARTRVTAPRKEQMALPAQELVEWALCLYDGAVAEFSCDASLAVVATASEQSKRAESRQVEQNGLGESREMILAAVGKLVAANGYWHLSLPRILNAAGLRKKSFTAHFQSVEDCFLATLSQRTNRVLRQAMAASRPESTWPEQVQEAIESLCAQIAADPATARLIFVDPHTVGPAGVRHQDATLSDLATRFDRAAPEEVMPLSRLRTEASLGAIWGILRHNVASERGSQIKRLAPVLSTLALASGLDAQVR